MFAWDKKLEKLWEEFGNIPIDNNDRITERFYHWKKGTNRFDIWHWFDDNHSKGLAKGIIEKREKEALSV